MLLFLIYPHANLEAYVSARRKWHSQNIISVGCDAAKNQVLEIEQYSFMLVMLKLLNTKAHSRLMPPSQISKITTCLTDYEPEFEEKARGGFQIFTSVAGIRTMSTPSRCMQGQHTVSPPLSMCG